MQVKNKLVEVYTPLSESEYMIARSILEEAGITCFSKNSTVQNLFGMGQVGTGYNYVTGPVRIQVRWEDRERAENLLHDVLTGSSETVEMPEICPACGSATGRAATCPSCDLNFGGPEKTPAGRGEGGADPLAEERLVKKYILRSFVFNWLWIFGLGNIIAILYALRALELTKQAPRRIKGRIFALLMLMLGALTFIVTVTYILLLATGHKKW